MNQKIEEILNELYYDDNSLKKNDKELREILTQMEKIKPEIEIDNDFKYKLKRQIHDEIENKKYLKPVNILNTKKLWNYFSYGFNVVWVLAILTLFINRDIFNYKYSWQPENDTIPQTSLKSNENILNDNQITPTWTTQTQSLSNEKMLENNAWAKSIKDNSTLSKKTLNNTSQSKKSVQNSVITPENTQNLDTNQESTTLDTSKDYYSLKDNSNLESNLMMFSPAVWSMKLVQNSWYKVGSWVSIWEDWILYQLNTLKDSDKIKQINNQNTNKLTNYSINEDKDYWYKITYDVDNNTITYSQNYSKWPEITNIENIITTDEIKNIYTTFAKDKNINISNYDFSQLKNIDLENTNISLFAPMIINNKYIYDNNSQLIWINLTIDKNYKKVIYFNYNVVELWMLSSVKLENNNENLSKILNNFSNENIENPTEITSAWECYIYTIFEWKYYLIPWVNFNISDSNKTISIYKWFYKYDNSWNIIEKKQP